MRYILELIVYSLIVAIGMMIAKYGFDVNPDVWEFFTITLLTLIANDFAKKATGGDEK